MKLERENAKPINDISVSQLRRELAALDGNHKSRIAILSDEHGNYIQVGGGGETCCLERRDRNDRHQLRAFQIPPVVKRPGITRLFVSDGEVSMREEDYFTIEQVSEAFVSFLRGNGFPEYLQWRDITNDLPPVPKPRELYLSACAEIGEFLSPLGFKYSRSGQHSQRIVGEFTHQIWFCSSHSNTLSDVDLHLYMGVFSKRLKKWRKGAEVFLGTRRPDCSRADWRPRSKIPIQLLQAECCRVIAKQGIG